MTSIFDQYEKVSQRSVPTNLPNTGVKPDADERPMFCKQKAPIEPTYKITHMTVSDDYLVFAMENNVLCRYDFKSGSSFKSQDIELSRIVPGVRLTGLFLDPTADHLLISFTTELLYQNRKSSKVKPLNKMRGHEVTAVSWHRGPRSGDSSISKPLLLGTSAGIILETELSSDESIFTSSHDLYSKQVFDIGKGSSSRITGLHYERLSEHGCYYVLVTTVDRLYQFVGSSAGPEDRPLLQHLFNKYLSIPEGFLEIPSGLNWSWLEVNTRPGGPPTLSWMTQTGILYAEVDGRSEDKLLTRTRMVSVPDEAGPPPHGLVLSDFHLLLLYQDKVTGISSLSEQTVFHDYYTESHGTLVGMKKDVAQGTVWVFAEKAIFRYKVIDEDRNVWKIYMERGQYEEAERFCKNAVSRDQVRVGQATQLFNQRKYEESAAMYAKTQSPLEEIALKFLQASQNQPLKLFLKAKLDKLHAGDHAQGMMLVLWVLELILSQLASLRAHGKANTEQYKATQFELQTFLSKPVVQERVKRNKSVVYELMGSHGDQENLTRLIKSLDDHDRLIDLHVHHQHYLKALEVLESQSNDELWYSYAPTLIQAIPKPTLSAVIARERSLNPDRLLPALVAADTDQAEELMRYLEFCINSSQEEALHNLLLTLYAQYRPDKLKRYLALQGDEKSMVNYDVGYAVRICREWGHKEACVKLLALVELWRPAVELALSIDLQLAVDTAASSPPHLARTLALTIAEHIVKEKDDIKAAMEFVEQCDQIKIEDILPFFPDFVTIDHFKDAICTSLQEYNQHMQDLKEEMDDATKSAELIRNEIHSFRSKFMEIEADTVCCCCELQLLLRPFYAFPCSHLMHTDCLVMELLPLLTESTQNRLLQLQREIASGGVKEEARQNLDSILASQCLYCGDYMIDLIDKPFIADEDYERIAKEWE